ncbi:hypothetical protein [Devosia nitrariae]|uniref:Uncharacterized protein n=1 Tax=Devosia nitrariae TaxID=2071872 RepID=A0ABQ5W118_9HYPH|nr:hypothetical protein [Devosia nitrariae]GLQ53610.1 hypothetical protein GCM10010862_08690 [Devosia nitrariae]
MADIRIRINRKALRQAEQALEAVPGVVARAAQSAYNGIALQARDEVRTAADRHFDNPEPQTLDAFYARQRRHASVHDVDDVTAAVGIREPAARWLGYHLGRHDQERLPGEIGPANAAIMIPRPENLDLPEVRELGVDVTLTKGGNMPMGMLRKLFSMTGPGGALFWGQLRPGGQRGIWARPLRKKGVKGQSAPKLIVAAVDRANYQPSFERPMRAAIRRATKTLPSRLTRAMRRTGSGR